MRVSVAGIFHLIMPTVLNRKLHALADVDLVRVLFRIDKLNNDTFQATVVEGHDETMNSTLSSPRNDPQGELYYVVVVLSVYAFAIVMFIASFVKKSGQDHGISIYMRDLEKVKRLEKRQEKFRFKLQMHKVHKDKKHRILGEGRAIVEPRRSSAGDVNEQNLLIKPGVDNASIWSLVSLEDNVSMLGAIHGAGMSASAPPSPGLPPQTLPPAPCSLPPAPLTPSIGAIPEVKIETCE